MNVYFGIFFAVLIAGACAVTGYKGYEIGMEHQGALDQKQFDQININLTAQKSQAAADLAKANADNMTLVTTRDTLKTQLEKSHAAAQIATYSLRTQLAGSSLRFVASQDSGCGASGGGAQAAGSNPASAPAATVVQLPDALAASLRSIAYDADKLRDNYAACYADDQVK